MQLDHPAPPASVKLLHDVYRNLGIRVPVSIEERNIMAKLQRLLPVCSLFFISFFMISSEAAGLK